MENGTFDVSIGGRRAVLIIRGGAVRIESEGEILMEADRLLSVRLYGHERLVLVWEDGSRRTVTVRVLSAPAASLYSILS